MVVIAGALVGGVPARAAAADPIVLAVDGERIYVELGARQGVGAGATLELQREVVARDPVNGATLRDRFAFGELTVVRAGDGVCEARAGEAVRGRVHPGDFVELLSAPARYVDPWLEQVEASRRPLPATTTAGGARPRDRAGAERAVAAAEQVRAVWRDTLGRSPAARVERWQEFVAAHPDSPYVPAIRKEIASLGEQAAALERAATAATASEPVRDRRLALAASLAALRRELGPQGLLWASVPARVRPGEPIAFAFALPAALPAGAAWLYVRGAGEAGFTRVPLTADGDAYLRATVPGERVRAGALAWFVEIGDQPVGQGSRDAPATIDVDVSVAEPPPARDRTSIETSLDYVDFDGGLAEGFDQYVQAELAFTYRFLTPVHAVRLGFGTLSGKGGPKDVIDADVMGTCKDAGGVYRCRQVDFSYVYTEVELHPRRNLAVMVRPQAGLLTTDTSEHGGRNRCRDATSLDDCEFFTGLGLRARVRFGEERGTNLELGVAFTSRVGTLLEAAYHWSPVRAVPIKLTAQFTDMPVPEDYGVRLVADVGWRGKRWVYPSLRLSYQARDIDHSGLSGGLGLNFDW
jgi:hypothetical protein